MTAQSIFEVVLRVTARNLTREEAEQQGFDLAEAESFGDEPYDPDAEPIDIVAIAECIADGFHEDAVSEMLAGSDLMSTIQSVELVRANEVAGEVT